MDIKVVDDQGQEIQQETTEIKTNYNPKHPPGDILLEQIGGLFDFTKPEINSYKTELKTLIDYAKMKTDDHSINGLKWALTDLGIRLGTPPMGEKRIKQMSRYAYLYMETKNNERRLHQMMRGEDDNY